MHVTLPYFHYDEIYIKTNHFQQEKKTRNVLLYNQKQEITIELLLIEEFWALIIGYANVIIEYRCTSLNIIITRDFLNPSMNMIGHSISLNIVCCVLSS